MSPEELDELQKSAEMVPCIGIQNAAVCRHPYNGVNNASFALVNLPDLLAHIDTQAAQIEALKEKLVEERSDRILRRQHDYEHNYSFTKSDALDLARQQLKAEMLECDLDE